jgi:hypothetical protein
MLKFFKRWLGWDSDSGFDFGDLRAGRGPATPRVSARARVAPGPGALAHSPPPAQPVAPQGQPQSDAAKKPQKERDVLEVLDDPRLTLDRPSDDGGFDPYNTGAFNRSTSWERIGRHKR